MYVIIYGITYRCYAALGDIPKTHFLNETLQIAENFAKENGMYRITIRVFIKIHDFKTVDTNLVMHDFGCFVILFSYR